MNFRLGNAKGDTASVCCSKFCVKRRVMRVLALLEVTLMKPFKLRMMDHL